MADFVAPSGVDFAWTRGSTPNSAYAQYDIFTTAAGPNSPDVGSFAGGTLAAGAPDWNAFDLSAGSLVTGGGNIYSPAGPLDIHVVAPNFDLGAGFTTTILLQVRTQGTEVDPASVNIGGVAPTFTQELSREALDGLGGFVVDTLYRWELPGNEASYELSFDALGPHMSLDRIAVDTFAAVVPAPGASALLGLAGLVAVRRRRA